MTRISDFGFQISNFKSLFRGIAISVLALTLCIDGQIATGGTYTIEKTAVASGGERSAGGVYALESTAGQPLAGGFLQSAGASVYSGFWVPVFAPTASSVSIGGRVLTAGGLGVRNARVVLTAPDGSVRFSLTGSFGYYRFDEVRVGATCVLTVSSRRYIFTNPTRVVTVSDEIGNLDFVAEE